MCTVSALCMWNELWPRAKAEEGLVLRHLSIAECLSSRQFYRM